jgi:hypothetical protein
VLSDYQRYPINWNTACLKIGDGITYLRSSYRSCRSFSRGPYANCILGEICESDRANFGRRRGGGAISLHDVHMVKASAWQESDVVLEDGYLMNRSNSLAHRGSRRRFRKERVPTARLEIMEGDPRSERDFLCLFLETSSSGYQSMMSLI